MKPAYIGLGTNVGNRLDNLRRAVLLLDGHDQILLKKLSSIYETDPVGYTEQENFLNMAAEISTDLPAHELLRVTSEIETRLGRERAVRWGPRTIDLDILLYNQENIQTESLQIPHPRMYERAFVLIPLAELYPSLCIPGKKPVLSDYIKQIPDKEGVRLWKQKCGAEKYALFEN
jgi:2-amino-4-hydroxy-6-hydroxymethyldihydropteridine diphosphokinase